MAGNDYAEARRVQASSEHEGRIAPGQYRQATSLDSVAFLQTLPVLAANAFTVKTVQREISGRDSYEYPLAACPAVAGTAGRPTMYATLALASINNAAR